MVNVMIVEDQRTVREALEATINNSKKYKIIHSIENAGMAEMYCMSGGVDLILMDVYTSYRENGIEAAKIIKEKYPEIKIIIVTSMPEHSFIEKAKEASCESFWYKDVGETKLIEVMDRTMKGESVYPDAPPVLKIGLAKSIEFTPRELDVLREKINGYSNQEVCQRLNIKKSTLDYHIGNILSKTGYANVLRLAMDVVEQKFILPNF